MSTVEILVLALRGLITSEDTVTKRLLEIVSERLVSIFTEA
jgi:hypothetical protein